MDENITKILENISAQMRKGVLDLAILLIVKERPVYTSEIIETLKIAELTVVEGTVYPLLARLGKTGLMKYSWVESNSGPPRKYYELTLLGQEVLAKSLAEWTSLTDAMAKLQTNLSDLKPKPPEKK